MKLFDIRRGMIVITSAFFILSLTSYYSSSSYAGSNISVKNKSEDKANKKRSEKESEPGSAQFMVEQIPIIPPPPVTRQTQPAITPTPIPVQPSQEQILEEAKKSAEMQAAREAEEKRNQAEALAQAEAARQAADQAAREADEAARQAEIERKQAEAAAQAQVPAPAPVVPAVPAAVSDKAREDAQANTAARESIKSVIETLPQKGGLYLIAPLEQEMWEAARQLDFEKAMALRDQINNVKQLPEFSEIVEIEKQMNEAAQSLEFEKAIEYREKIRELQLNIQVPAVLKPKVPEIKFRVKGFRVSGNTAIDTAELMKYTEGLADREITLTDVREAASAIKQRYREMGYIAAYVYVPPQALEEGMLEIHIIEGKLGAVRVRGNEYFATETLLNHFNMTPGEVVTFETVKQQLLQLNRHRDIQARAVFEPGQEPETTDLILDVEDKLPWHLSVDANNYGTRLTGTERVGTTLSHTNLFGNLDEINLRYQGSENTSAFAVDYNSPIFNTPLRGGLAFSHGGADLGGDFKAINAEGVATTYSTYATMPTWSWPGMDTSLRLGFDKKSVENSLLDTTTGRDELSIINGVFNIEQTDAWGKTYWPNALHFGIDAFGASAKNSESLIRSGSGAPFMIYRSELDRFLYLPNDMMFQLHSAWQLTPDALPSSEQMQLGGFHSVRGYPQGEYVGDYGAIMNLELAVPIYGLAKEIKVPFDDASLYDNLRMIGFYDYGTANLRGALPGEASKKDLSGAGVGMRLRFFDRLSAQLEWGLPLAEQASDGSDGVFYYGISYDVL